MKTQELTEHQEKNKQLYAKMYEKIIENTVYHAKT